MGNWSDAFAWWMDLLKSAIGYMCGLALTIGLFIFYFDREKHKWEANYGLKLETFKEYEKASGRYRLKSYDALYAAYHIHNGRNQNEDIKTWQDECYDNLDLAEHSLRRWFKINHCENSTINNSLEELRLIREDIKIEFDAFQEAKYEGDSIKRAKFWGDYRRGRWQSLSSKYIDLNNRVLLDCQKMLD